jgi:uncharacterized repeat protein (TIGR03803 family)
MTIRPGFGSVWVLLPLLLLCANVAHAAPTYKILHAFGSGQDGGGAWSSVTLDKQGNIYGTTSLGGQYDCGIVFELTPGSQGNWTEEQLYSFKCGTDGNGPFGGVTFDTAGNLYGTTTYGGQYGDAGTVFELAPSASGWQETVIYNFGSHSNDAYAPHAGVTIDKAGNLYGTGHSVYEVQPGADGWTETVIDEFSRPHDGSYPYAGLILDKAGNLYGTTEYGGLGTTGTVYELHPTADGVWQERLFSACGSAPCPAGPGPGDLITDGASSLYGTTYDGGKNRCGENYCGTVYRLTREVSGQVKGSVLYNFQYNATGFGPAGGVVRDEAGNLYGTTIDGGSAQCSCGVVYELSPGANDQWTYTLLHTFTGYDGAEPDANLTFDGQGNLYGTTAAGGPYGGGVVFEITP